MSIGIDQSATEQETGPEEPRRGGRKWRIALLSLVGVFVVLAGYDLFAVSGQVTRISAAPRPGPATSATDPASAISSAAPPATAVLTPASRPLPVMSIAAFGPAGQADGDNPGVVSQINGAGAQPWYSSWYASPEFGNLQAGTGLLLDMGKPVTVTSVRLVLGSRPGADVQVRVGNSAIMSGLSDVASASDAGGAVRLGVTPSSTGRYVLVWFTRLPPNGRPGQYQVDVYGVTVDGIDLKR